MANKFDFAFVLKDNLNLKYFPVSQAMVTFTVTGDDDPLTLQLMRDAVHGEFVKTQTKVNNFIKSRNAEIFRLGINQRAQKKDVQLIDSGNQTIQNFLNDFKKAADALLDAFQRKQAAKAQKIAASPGTAASALKWVISVGWTLFQGSKAVADIYGAEGPLKIIDGIKGFVDALKDLQELIGKVQDYFASEKAVNVRLRAALKSLAAKKSFTEGDVKALDDLVHLYETKVLGMEITAKSLSAKITQAIGMVPSKGIASQVQKEAEEKLDELLKGLVQLQTTLKPIEKQLLKYKLNLGAAKAFAKKGAPQSWVSWAASKAYDFKDTAFSAWEKKLADVAQDLTEKWVDYLIKKFSVPENVVAKI